MMMLWEQPQIPEKVNLKVDWERLGKTFQQVLTVGMAVVANYGGRGTWYPGKIVKVKDDSTYHKYRTMTEESNYYRVRNCLLSTRYS